MASHGVHRVSGAALDKSVQAKEKERKQIEAYKAFEKDVKERIAAKDFSNTTFQQTTTLLTQNPEYYTIWNDRRRLLTHVFAQELSATNTPTTEDAAAAEKAGLTVPQHQISLLIKEDLSFLIPLLRQFPKCYWIWNHRSWLLSQATQHLPASTAAGFWRAELGLVGKMLALDSRNFHGWGYRRTVVEEIEVLGGGDCGMVEQEFEYTTKMIRTNLSNFSAWHYRSTLIPKLLSSRSAGQEERREFLDAEFELITQALYTDPYDQSLWFYHQYLLATPDVDNAQAPPILEPCTDEERRRYLAQEIESLREMLDGAEDCKYIYLALLECSRRASGLGSNAAGEREVSDAEMTAWLGELRKLDPLREGRWRDLERALKL